MSSLTASPVPGSKSVPATGHPIRLLVILLGLYTAQSIVNGVMHSSLPVILRDAGLGLDQIGLMSLLTLPWALKIFWAPMVDRFGHTTIWILSCQLCLVLSFTLMALLDVPAMPVIALTFFVIIALAASTQDIATDATAIQATNQHNRTLASGASTAGGYLGYLLGGGVWLWVYANHGWRVAALFAAFILLALTLPVLFGRGELNERGGKADASLMASFKSSSLRRGLLVVLGWQLAVRLTLTLSGPLLVDAGLKLGQIAWIQGIGSMGVGLLSALAATFLASRIGPRLLLHFAAAVFILMALAHVAWVWGWLSGTQIIIGLSLGFSAAISVSFVAIYAVMIGFCDPARASTDFSILQAFDVVLLVVAGILSGILAERFGYAPVFLLAASLMVLSWPLTLRLAKNQLVPPTNNPE